mmetsp:Transcript_22999/g.26369  ORF Transcript_22999/g.26369 Transcript_22999/m.26369 type:complete len:91 (-) Transcript_22999:81-353(-)
MQLSLLVEMIRELKITKNFGAIQITKLCILEDSDSDLYQEDYMIFVKDNYDFWKNLKQIELQFGTLETEYLSFLQAFSKLKEQNPELIIK